MISMSPAGDAECDSGSTRLSPLAIAGLVCLGTVILVAYSSWARPLWIDEFVHFALGGLPPQLAMQTLYNTLGPSLSHGQTGLYMLWDYTSLRLFGTNLFAFRLPSLLSAAVLLYAAVQFFRTRGISAWWMALAMVTLAAQSTLMWHAGNARPYMMLAAAVVAALAYYETSQSLRHQWHVRLLGWGALLIGAAGHPYFAPFLVMVLGFAAWHAHFERRITFTMSSIRGFLNPPLLLASALVYVVVGAATWMRGTPSFASPSPDPLGFARQVVRAHFGMVLPSATEMAPAVLSVALAIVVSGTVLLVWLGRGRNLLPPMVLLALGLSSTIAVSAVSLVKQYEIFERQWVVGMALAALSLVWLMAEIWRTAPDRRRVWARALVLVVIVLFAANGIARTWESASSIPAWVASWPQRAAEVAPDAESMQPGDWSIDDWVDLANDNVALGGHVWPSVARYYDPYLP